MLCTLLAQVPGPETAAQTQLIEKLLQPEVLVFLIPITAILTGGAIALVKMLIRHRERLAMIEQGMHPDEPPEGSDSHDV